MTPVVKIEQEAVAKDEKPTKDDDSTNDAKETSESAIKTEDADDIANQIAASMVSLATKAKPIAVDADKKKEGEGEGVQIKMETDSTDTEDESTVVSESKAKSTNNWDNSYTNELKKMYSDVDADTRAVAEEMIRAAAGSKKSQDDEEQSSKASEKKEKEKEDSSKKNEKKKNETSKKPIPKGQEPSALELALKQQGITQSDQLRSTQFPFRLHNMLDDAERSGHAHIVSWCSGGESFKIHKPNLLINVLQKYFRQSKFKSFLRQLQGYNFKRITRGKDQGVVSHPLFLRGRRSVSTLMRRKRVGPKPDADPNANKVAANFKKVAGNQVPSQGPPTPPTRILPTPHSIASRSMPPAIHSAGFMHKGILNPRPQDVLCVDYPNGHQVRQFQGNRKLASIVQKITGHYTSANESVRTMIVNEISSRIQNSGSRFLKLSKDGLSWVECNREEMFRRGTSK